MDFLFHRARRRTMSVMLLVMTASVSFSSRVARAGAYELGLSATYRKSTINSNNYQESNSYTGSIGYYFGDMSALEVSYTSGESHVVTQPPGYIKMLVRARFQMTGLDLVLSASGRDSHLQPYLKLGAAYIQKTISQQIDGSPSEAIPGQKGVVPSVGIGFKINLTKQFGIKVGVDAWTSPLSDSSVVIDFAGRAGLSLLF